MTVVSENQQVQTETELVYLKLIYICQKSTGKKNNLSTTPVYKY